jgi:hypothetical protein
MNWERLRVLHGPSQIGGQFYRLVEAYTSHGGHQLSVESWCGHQWDMGGDGPGFAEVKNSPPASFAELAAAKIPKEEFPAGYDPIGECKICHPQR